MNILVSGAGIAGATAAYFLSRSGHRVTVIERSAGQRSSGAPVDVEGPAVAVAEKMGVLSRLRQAATQVDGMTFIGASGRPAVRVDISALHRASASRDVELPRAELASILTAAAGCEVVYDESVASLAQDEGGVDVGFLRGASRRFDLVIGADGLHSTVRRLAFGPERQLVRYAGLYVATFPVESERGRDIVMFNAPGRSATIHPSSQRPMAAFIFWSPALPDVDHRDRRQHEAVLDRVYAGDGWRVPELLEQAKRAGDLYFDSVSAVEVPRWSNGRVVLVGDAASCVSLFGNGSTLAMAGGFALAEALAASTELPTALAAYEARHRKLVDPRLKRMALGASLLVPTTRAGIATRNLLLHLWPLLAAVSRVRRLTAEVA